MKGNLNILKEAVDAMKTPLSRDFSIGDDALKKLVRYGEMVLEANRSMNLTGAADFKTLAVRHISDSLALLNFAKMAAGVKVLDIGTGAGFPGMALAIATDAEFTLLDSLQKRIGFLESVALDLDLKNVELTASRAEDFIRAFYVRESFDICVSRAVAPLNLLLEYNIPYLKEGGKFFSYKSAAYEKEVAEAENALKTLNCELAAVHSYILADKSEFRLLEFKKTAQTPDKYPRRAGIPAKRPL